MVLKEQIPAFTRSIKIYRQSQPEVQRGQRVLSTGLIVGESIGRGQSLQPFSHVDTMPGQHWERIFKVLHRRRGKILFDRSMVVT